jgi:hypothetical protein
MENIENFMLWTKARFEQMQDTVDAQQLVMAWLLSQLEHTEGFETDRIREFLLNQSMELVGSPKHGNYVAVIDSLFEDLASFSSLRHSHD